MQIRRTFFLTFSLFLTVWAFFAIERYFEDLRMGKEQDSSCLQASLLDGEVSDVEEGGALPLDLEAELSRILVEADRPAIETQVSEIDRQLQELQDMKRGFEARARRHDDQAQRLQFEDRAVLETRRHIELADENRQKAARVQLEIDRLQLERKKLLS